MCVRAHRVPPAPHALLVEKGRSCKLSIVGDCGKFNFYLRFRVWSYEA